MTLRRRDVLLGGISAGASGLLLPTGDAATGIENLTATPTTVQLAPSGYPATPIWAYEDSAPGPILRARRGDRLVRRLVNGLPEPTTVHWHGIRIDNAMDGVPDLTQDAVAPGADFLYDFALNDAGTYWYHSHARPWEQVERGLHGALIVDEDTPPGVDREEILVLDDWRLDAQAQIDESFGSMRDRSHAGRIGNFITVNGDPEHRLSARQHERLRLRLINAANARIFDLGLQGLDGRVVALDGQPLAQPQPVERVQLAPAQRADLIVDVLEGTSGEGILISFERDGGYALTSIGVDGTLRSSRLQAPAAIAANDVPALGPLDEAPRFRLYMAGGAMGGMQTAIHDGKETGIRDLVGAGQVWAFNGVAGRSDVPFLSTDPGRTIRIEIVNDTRWQHAMHLHGHHFRRLGKDGRIGPLRDTLLVDRGETAEIAFVADNPGDWLFHCHMLEHAVSGMSTWMRVAA